MLCNDVLIENIKYGCVIRKNNGAMKKLTSRMRKQLKPGILSTVCECQVRGYFEDSITRMQVHVTLCVAYWR